MSQKVWGVNDISNISQEMVNQNRGNRHGYTERDIQQAMRGMERQFSDKDISFVARQLFSILSGGGSY